MKSEDFIIKCKVIKEFTLKDFNKLENLVRGGYKNDYGKLYTNDIFECEKEMADYLMGENPFNEIVIKILEVEPKNKSKKKNKKASE